MRPCLLTVDRCPGQSHFLAVVSSVVVYMSEHVSLWDPDFEPFGKSASGMSYDSSFKEIVLFSV